MAKKNIGGGIVMAATNDKGSVMSLRGDGAILRQFRIDGRLEGATIVARINVSSTTTTAKLMVVFAKYATRYGYTIPVATR